MSSEHPFLVGLLGAGVGPSLTPSLHMQEGRHQGLTYLYRVIDTSENQLDEAGLRRVLDAARLLGFDGLNITFPYKQRIIPLLDQLEPTARRLGAVNTVLIKDGRLEGHNTDVTGFAAAVERHLPDAARDSVVQLGAGGAGAAVAEALLGLGVADLTLVDRDLPRATALAESLSARFGDRRVRASDTTSLRQVLGRASGLVNCTPTGMAHHPGLPVDPNLIRSDLWVADIVYRPLHTELLRHAADRGCQVLHGGFMAVYQAAHAFELITGRSAEPQRMLAHLCGMVESQPHA